MKKLANIGLSLLLLMAFYQKTSSQSGNQPVKSGVAPETSIQRVVCFKFKPATSAEAIQQHLQGLAALKDSIPAILSYQADPTIQGELNQKPKYDVMHYLTFRTEADIKLYYGHPAHVRFAQKNSKNWEGSFVVGKGVSIKPLGSVADRGVCRQPVVNAPRPSIPRILLDLGSINVNLALRNREN